ncbi:uncharacterized protein N7473_008021 [Penicillium subrubescens]|uniref:Uncharacterized protein n=1 Tax=Penicillium subrubescens TaxID=1316194 RepID=A0A1Q5TFH5_9EURO|nr:uncharacterized protein N7473_008021 [Penicillium subrubescens]KAJ5891793.1 hypothetical protein N7473_008021 [Penicillium subrubescens]OKO98986.1 hypothetical protein PENSUB_8903 [Penicillium subrubescens]
MGCWAKPLYDFGGCLPGGKRSLAMGYTTSGFQSPFNSDRSYAEIMNWHRHQQRQQHGTELASDAP